MQQLNTNPALRRPRSSLRLQQGMSLLEIIIAVGVLGTLMMLAARIEGRADRESDGRTAADAQVSFMNAAAQRFLDNRVAYENAMKDGTGAATLCRISVNADGSGGTQANSVSKHTCAFDTTYLRGKNVWPPNGSVDEADGRYAVILRMVYDTQATPQPTGGDEALFVFMRPDGVLQPVIRDGQRLDETLSTMRAIGGMGGFVPVGNVGPCKSERLSSTYQACGNGWKVNLSDFVDAPQLATFANALPN
jgi:prepilin-type N-terminal cleavage/methylation domain-containing protein